MKIVECGGEVVEWNGMGTSVKLKVRIIINGGKSEKLNSTLTYSET